MKNQASAPPIRTESTLNAIAHPYEHTPLPIPTRESTTDFFGDDVSKIQSNPPPEIQGLMEESLQRIKALEEQILSLQSVVSSVASTPLASQKISSVVPPAPPLPLAFKSPQQNPMTEEGEVRPQQELTALTSPSKKSPYPYHPAMQEILAEIKTVKLKSVAKSPSQ